MIKRGNRVFIQPASIGECDDKGKVALSLGFKGKMIADPDKPMSTLTVPLIEEYTRFARYSSLEALKADLVTLSAYVASLERRSETPPEDASATAPELGTSNNETA